MAILIRESLSPTTIASRRKTPCNRVSLPDESFASNSNQRTHHGEASQNIAPALTR